MNAGLSPKRAVRARIRTLLSEATEAEVAAWSGVIGARLVRWLGARESGAMMSYWPAGGEPALRPALAEAAAMGWRIGLPRMDWEAGTMEAVVWAGDESELEVRRHGISEPRRGDVIPSNELDVVVVPGLAFDSAGRRLGRGGGFYDRYLARACDVDETGSVTRGPLLCGVCFEFQVWEGLPTEDHDVRVDLLMTEGRLVVARPDRAG